MASEYKVIPVPNRLAQLLRKPGGIERGEAVSAAGRNVESLRDAFVAAIPGEVAALEEILATVGEQSISSAGLDEMLRRAAQILTLSGTYGFSQLDDVVKRFCDLANGMIEKKIVDVAPVRVHLRAMRLFCPGAQTLTDAEAANVLEGLERVRTHYGITPIATQPA